MNEISEKNFVGFIDFFQALASKKIVKTKDGALNILGKIISAKDFNSLYMKDINYMLSEFESTISPEFNPNKDLYSTLDVLSSPVLKETKVPDAVKGFYKKLNIVLSTNKDYKKSFENDITEYVKSSNDAPVFMLASLDKEIDSKDSTFRALMPSSSTLLDGYGTKYSGEDILSLAEEGFIDAKAPINMLIAKSLYAQNEKAEDYTEPVSYNQLLDFYSPEKHPGRMHSLLANGQIDKNFSDLHTELLDNVSKKDKKDYIQDLIDEAKSLASSPADYSNDLLAYANANIIPDSSLSQNITADFLKAKFIAKEISISRIIDIYESDTKYFKPLETILTPTEIEKAHSKDELEDKALMYLPKNSRIAYLQKSNTGLNTIMYLFLHCDGISVTELQKLLSATHNVETLDFYIDKGSSPARIKELFENYLIDYGCIKNLVSDGIITERDLEKYKLGIPKEKIYDKIQNLQSIEITGNTNIVPFSTTGAFIGIQSSIKDTTSKTTDLYGILGNVSEDSFANIPIISHKKENNRPNFLDGYKILPLKPTNLVAFIPPEPIRTTYIMPYQETAYILENRALPHSFPDNPAFKEIRFSEKMHEDILNAVYQFEEAKKYLADLGYSEDLNFEEAMRIMTEEYIKIKTKGEN